MTESPLTGQVAIVTGSARNIGRAIALALAQSGCSLTITAAHDQAAAEEVAAEVAALGAQASVHLADVSSEQGAQGLVDATIEKFGRVDILVSSAAIRREHPVTEVSYQEWREVLGVALDGAFLLSRACVPHMIEQGGGRIIAIGGSPSHIGTPNRTHVLSAKMGLVGLIHGLATELGVHNITANIVAPGHVDTTRGASAGTISSVKSDRPISRKALPEEIAAMVRYLCLPEAAYITGQTIHVNGGMYMAGA